MTVRYSKERVKVHPIAHDRLRNVVSVGDQVCFGNGLELTIGHILWISFEGRVTLHNKNRQYHRDLNEIIKI